MWRMSSRRAPDVILTTWFMKMFHWWSFWGSEEAKRWGESTQRKAVCEMSPAKTRELPDSTCSSSHGYAHGLNFEREPGEDARTAMTSESALLVRESPAGYMNDTKLPNLWNGRINAYSILLCQSFAAILTLNVISGFLMHSKSLILIDDNWAYSYFPPKQTAINIMIVHHMLYWCVGDIKEYANYSLFKK